MFRPLAVTAVAALVLGGCTTARETHPERTATEQLLISSAADRAAEKLNLGLPAGTKVYLDGLNLDGPDGRYALGAVRDRLLRGGVGLVSLRSEADAIVEVRAGALSIDNASTLVGIPAFELPVPLAGDGLTLPEIALFKKAQRRAIAKFAAVGYSAKDGRLIASTAPQYGHAHKTKWTVLLFLSWTRTDAIPRGEDYDPLAVERPELP